MIKTKRKLVNRKKHKKTLSNTAMAILCGILIFVDVTIPSVALAYEETPQPVEIPTLYRVIEKASSIPTINYNLLLRLNDISSETDVVSEGEPNDVVEDTETDGNNLSNSQEPEIADDPLPEELKVYKERITVMEENVPEYVEPLPIIADPNNIGIISNATPEQLQTALVNTGHWMAEYNLGYVFYNLEQQYGVNAFFAMAVTTQEVGYSKSNVCINHNNMFGIRKKSNGKYVYRDFNSYEECIEYFYNLIANTYMNSWGRYDTYSINQKYCETPDWYQCVNSLMTRLSNNIY